ncbi:MAG: hypothetical protein JWM12_3751 [Ilumatobacteraceae bacterium]|nr:hypothetical protein [Ilumatobacteraceae bacterium]
MTVTVTVVTPVYNGTNYLAHTLASVRAQTFADFEHLVVDDGSTDATADLVREFAERDPRVRLVQQPNQGLSAARNTGLRLASPTSEFVLFVDHDDLMRPRSLELLVAALRGVPGALAAHGTPAAVDGDGEATPLVRPEAAVRRTVIEPARWWSRRADTRILEPSEPSGLEALGYVLFIYTPGQVLLRRAELQRLGGFDPLLRVAQDYDLWLRISARAPIVYVPDVVLDYRQTSHSLSADQTTTRREDLHARFKTMTDASLPAEVRALARHLHRQHEWHRAGERVGMAKVALRRRDVREVAREAVRIVRSSSEALLAVVPWEWPYARRVRRYRRSMGGDAGS